MDTAMERKPLLSEEERFRFEEVGQRAYNQGRGFATAIEELITSGELMVTSKVFPVHKAGMTLTHNDHLGVYETVAQQVKNGDFGCLEEDWVSEEQRDKAIATNERWTLQWYPDNAVSFNVASAADLHVLLAHVGSGARIVE